LEEQNRPPSCHSDPGDSEKRGEEERRGNREGGILAWSVSSQEGFFFSHASEGGQTHKEFPAGFVSVQGMKEGRESRVTHRKTIASSAIRRNGRVPSV